MKILNLPDSELFVHPGHAWRARPFVPFSSPPAAPRRSDSTLTLLCPAQRIVRLTQLVGVRHQIELYPGVHHGFAFPERKIYDKPAAERHWERLIALYRRRLG